MSRSTEASGTEDLVETRRAKLLNEDHGCRQDVDLGRLVRNYDQLDFVPLEKVSHTGVVDEGMVASVISRDLSGSTDLSLVWGRFAPGQHHLCHHHSDASEFFVIIEGTPTIWLGSHTFRAAVGDTIYVPKGVMHGVTNDTDGEVVMLAGMSMPADWEFIFDE